MSTKIKTSIIAALILFLNVLPAFAAVDIQTIAGMPKDATAAEFIVYFFNLAVAIGGFIAVVIVITAGIEWMTSEGNPGKVEGAKDKIKNTLLGVAVLIGSYVILNTINPQLNNIKINQLTCSQGITVMQKPSESSTDKSKQVCITNSTSSLGYYITGTGDWNFQADTILKVYAYTEENFAGTRTEFSCENGGCSGKFQDIPSSTKSIYLLMKNPGLYMYDKTDYALGVKSYPFFTSSSIANLGDSSFDNFAGSVKIVDPPEAEKIRYQAVLFDGLNYTGNCSFLAASSPDLSKDLGGNYPTPIGNGKLSSLIVTKFTNDQTLVANRDSVTLYTKPDCVEPSASSGTEVKSKTISWSGQHDIYGDPQFPTGFSTGDEVRSFKISGALGLAISTTTTAERLAGKSGECRYYDIRKIKDGVCYSDIAKDGLYSPGTKKPMSYVVVEVDK